MAPDTAVIEGEPGTSVASEIPQAEQGSALLVGLDRLTGPLQGALEARGISCYVAHQEEVALESTRAIQPELILVGSASEVDPASLIPRLARTAGEARILYLITRHDSALAREAFSWGAGEVVTPPHSASKVLFRADVLNFRVRPQAPEDTAADGAPPLTIFQRSRSILQGDTATSLTEREYQLLQRLLDENGSVVERGLLLQDIWGEEQTSEAVLDATVHRLRRKLEEDPASPRRLITVRGIGYRLQSGRVQFAD